MNARLTPLLAGMGLCQALSGLAHAQGAAAQDTTPSAAYPRQLIWSAGVRLKMDDVRDPGRLTPRPMIGLRYGRWRTGPVDGETWHRFGQLMTDNTLTYDWLDSSRWRTSLSASIVNFQKDATIDLLEPGRKTVRGKATVDYMGWSHWSVGVVLTQDLLGRGAGTAVSPSLTYRQALSDDSTLLLRQSFTWGNATLWDTEQQFHPDSAVRQGSGWGGMNTSLTYRQRWTRHVSFYMQASRNHVLGPVQSMPQTERTTWGTQAGVIYFGR